MYKNVFFSFHFDDVFVVNQIRHSGMIRGVSKSGFKDKAEFEKIKLEGNKAVKKWIDKQMEGTSVTAVLIGEETLGRDFVQYEIEKSVERGNAIIGITMDDMKKITGVQYKSTCDTNTVVYYDKTGMGIRFIDVADGVYSYANQNGYEKLGSWIETATKRK